MDRNKERYEFLKWASAFENFRVVPLVRVYVPG